MSDDKVYEDRKIGSYSLSLAVNFCLISCILLISCSRTENESGDGIFKSIGLNNEGRQTQTLQSMFGKKWELVCIQTPYLRKGSFEKNANRKISEYDELSDTSNALWFFGENNIKIVVINRINQADYFPLKGPPCINADKGVLVVETNNGARRFYLSNEKE